jgi:hypothetical protein
MKRKLARPGMLNELDRGVLTLSTTKNKRSQALSFWVIFSAILFWQAGYAFALSGKDGDTVTRRGPAKPFLTPSVPKD